MTQNPRPHQRPLPSPVTSRLPATPCTESRSRNPFGRKPSRIRSTSPRSRGPSSLPQASVSIVSVRWRATCSSLASRACFSSAIPATLRPSGSTEAASIGSALPSELQCVRQSPSSSKFSDAQRGLSHHRNQKARGPSAPPRFHLTSCAAAGATRTGNPACPSTRKPRHLAE